jgi:hypothetical protein
MTVDDLAKRAPDFKRAYHVMNFEPGRQVWYGTVRRHDVEVGLLVGVEHFTIGRVRYVAWHYEAATLLDWETIS